MNIEDFSDEDVLRRADAIKARKRKEERLAGFEEQDTVTIRWTLSNVKGGRKYLGQQGYDGVEVSAEDVADLVTKALKP